MRSQTTSTSGDDYVLIVLESNCSIESEDRRLRLDMLSLEQAIFAERVHH